MAKETVATLTGKLLAQGEQLDTLSGQLARVLDALAQGKADSDYEDAVATEPDVDESIPSDIPRHSADVARFNGRIDAVVSGKDTGGYFVDIRLRPGRFISGNRKGTMHRSHPSYGRNDENASDQWVSVPLGRSDFELYFRAGVFFMREARKEKLARNQGVDGNPMGNSSSNPLR